MNDRELQLIEVASKAGRKCFYHLVPRYTSGSPAMVDLGTFVHVASGEEAAHGRALEGIYGEERKNTAETKGLEGIAYCRWQKGNKVFRLDILTGKEFEEPKRLDWKERKRALDLINRRTHVGLRGEDAQELRCLEYRAEIHREPLQP